MTRQVVSMQNVTRQIVTRQIVTRQNVAEPSPLVKHTTAVSEFPVPADKPALQRFLGMLNFYRKFLRGAAGVLAPLTDALKGAGKTHLDSRP